MPKRLIAANNLFEEPLLNFARQVRPEAKNAAANQLLETRVLAHGILLRRAGSRLAA
jgi:hypothetical protein